MYNILYQKSVTNSKGSVRGFLKVSKGSVAETLIITMVLPTVTY